MPQLSVPLFVLGNAVIRKIVELQKRAQNDPSASEMTYVLAAVRREPKLYRGVASLD
jgi:hypothetical protein